MMCVLAAVLMSLITLTTGLDNGLALTPPMGWRNWNAWLQDVNQSRMEAAINAVAQHRNFGSGLNSESLAELGYDHVGLDDFWQACGQGVNGMHSPAASCAPSRTCAS